MTAHAAIRAHLPTSGRPAWHGRSVIIWLNGTFGVGKTTTARLLSQRDQSLRLFDPEWVGYMLRENLSDYPVTDLRHWESWRVLTPVVADELIRFSGQSLVAPQTVLEEDYWDELMSGLSVRGHDVLHVVLDAEDESMRGRIEADQVDPAAKPWRLNHMLKFADARTWIAETRRPGCGHDPPDAARRSRPHLGSSRGTDQVGARAKWRPGKCPLMPQIVCLRGVVNSRGPQLPAWGGVGWESGACSAVLHGC